MTSSERAHSRWSGPRARTSATPDRRCRVARGSHHLLWFVSRKRPPSTKNGQQYPNAIHMAVTRPQTQPGVVEQWGVDLTDAVSYAQSHKDDAPQTGAIYGGVAGGSTDEIDSIVNVFMADMMYHQSFIPAR